MKKLIFCVLMALSSASFAQTFSEAGCQLYATVAASGASERMGKIKKGETLKTLEQAGYKVDAPGRVWELFERAVRMAQYSKKDEQATFEAAYIACLAAGGSVDKLIPEKI